VKKQRERQDRQSSGNLSRRAVIQGAAALAAGTAASTLLPSRLVPAAEAKAPPAPYTAEEILVSASPRKNVVETDSGKVFGYVRDGIVTFKGIRYGASTAGKNRFMPPARPAPWAGVRSAVYWGPVAPQPFTSTIDGRRGGWSHPDEAFMFEWEDGHDSEDCLCLNVWTPSINDNAKRPVMVWLHGGGYVAGSSQELRMYPGEGLAKRGDVVVVSVNHRLGVLGFANLMELGEQYASSPNVGMLDLVAALEWVKTNISNFGGDPNRVLIFGQSGGGGKVSTLMGMPAAKGLFHRGVVESGSLLTDGTRKASARMTTAVLAELGLNRNTIGRIHELPYQQIVEAALHSQRVSSAEGVGGMGFGWGPVVDGKILPRAAWDPTAPSYSADVPMIIGTTLNEFFNSVQMEDHALDSMSLAEARKRLAGTGGPFSFFGARLGDHTDHVIEVFRKAYPKATPFEMFSRISATAMMRLSALTQAERKTAQGAAPAYNYWFQWQTPVLDGRARAFHCSELPFVFYNTERCAPMTGGGPEALDLAGRMADAWIQFARTGDPNHPGLPKWPAYDAAKISTMIFNDKCVVENDPDGEIRKAIAEARARS
jgi:para-nitrobenzyl esterase